MSARGKGQRESKASHTYTDPPPPPITLKAGGGSRSLQWKLFLCSCCMPSFIKCSFSNNLLFTLFAEKLEMTHMLLSSFCFHNIPERFTAHPFLLITKSSFCSQAFWLGSRVDISMGTKISTHCAQFFHLPQQPESSSKSCSFWKWRYLSPQKYQFRCLVQWLRLAGSNMEN